MNVKDGVNRLPLGFVYYPELVAADGTLLRSGPPTRNLIPQPGIDHLTSLLRGTSSVISQWYIGLYQGNFVPGRSTSAADLQAQAQEMQAYSEATRPEWDEAYDGVSVIDNFGSRAEFTLTADRKVYGAFLVSDSSKGGNSGTLLSIARFPSPYDIPAGATFRLGVSIALIPDL